MTARAALAAILAGSVIVDLLFFTGFIASDDVLYMTAARTLAQTGSLWPDPAAHEARLLMIGWCALVGGWVKDDVQAVAASFVLFHQLLNVLTFALARRLGGAAVGLLAAGLSATSPLLVVFSTTILPDIPMAVCFVAAFVAFRSAYVDGPGRKRARLLVGLAGGSLGLAYLAKESGLVPVPFFLALAFVYERWSRGVGGGTTGALSRVASFLAGLGLVLALEAVMLRALTGSWLFRLGSLLERGGEVPPSLAALGQRAMTLARMIGGPAAAAVVLLIVGAAIAQKARRSGLRATLLFPAWYLAYYTLGSARLTSYSSPSLQVRYLIPCVPFLLAAAALGVGGAYAWALERVRKRHPRPERLMHVAGAILLAALTAVQLVVCDREAGQVYGAPLVSQSLRALRFSHPSGPRPLVLSETLSVQLFPLFLDRPEGLLLSHEVGPDQLERWRRQAGFDFMDLHSTSALGRAELNPLLGWPHGLPVSERRAESLVESLLSGRASESGWIMREAGRFDRTGSRSTEVRVLFGDAGALGRLEFRPDRGVVVYRVTAAGGDSHYPLPALSPGEAPQVVNGTFDHWSEAGPAAWRSRDALASRTRGPDGGEAVRIGPGAFSYLWQSLRVPASLGGRRLVLRAQVRSDAPQAARLWIKVAVGADWEEAFGEPHPGDATWRPLEAVIPVPLPFAEAEARVVLLHAGTRGHSEFDDVDLSVR